MNSNNLEDGEARLLLTNSRPETHPDEVLKELNYIKQSKGLNGKLRDEAAKKCTRQKADQQALETVDDGGS